MFGKLLKSALNVAVSPVDVLKDVATLGGALTDESEPYTVQRAKKAGKCLGQAMDEVEKFLEPDEE